MEYLFTNIVIFLLYLYLFIYIRFIDGKVSQILLYTICSKIYINKVKLFSFLNEQYHFSERQKLIDIYIMSRRLKTEDNFVVKF